MVDFYTIFIIIFFALLLFFLPFFIKLGVVLYYWLFPGEAQGKIGKKKNFTLSKMKEVK